MECFTISSSVQFISVAQSCPTAAPWTAACQASLSIINSQSLLKLMSIESVIPFSSCLQSFRALESFPMSQFFTSGSQSIGVSASASVLPFQHQYSGLISFRMDWLDLLRGQGTLKSLLQHHSSKASILWCSTFFIVQLSHPYMTTGKTMTRRTFVHKVMSLLFNMLSRWAITLLPGASVF